jgi:hypothetical protein
MWWAPGLEKRSAHFVLPARFATVRERKFSHHHQATGDAAGDGVRGQQQLPEHMAGPFAGGGGVPFLSFDTLLPAANPKTFQAGRCRANGWPPFPRHRCTRATDILKECRMNQSRERHP